MFAAVLVAVSCSAVAAAAWQVAAELKRTAAEVKAAAALVQAEWSALLESVEAVRVAVVAGESRQDRLGGLQSDVSRHLQQALQEFRTGGPRIWLQRQLQSVFESSARRAAVHAVDPAALWQLQCTEVQLVCCRDYLLEPGNAELQQAVRNCSLRTLPRSLWSPETLQQAAQRVQNVQAGGAWTPLEVQLADRVQEVQALLLSEATQHAGVVALCRTALTLE
jgi:hypothetical protein